MEDSPSKMVTEMEAHMRRRARVLPAGPAPMMAMATLEAWDMLWYLSLNNFNKWRQLVVRRCGRIS